jgi:hypothetical protein
MAAGGLDLNLRPPPHNIQHELLMATEEKGEYFLGLSWLLFADPWKSLS